MSFLMPLFLWLLPFTAIPLIIHLLNQRNLITINFSTLRFLKLLERESIKKLKLLQIILLILRTIIILFLIIMITRPIIRGIYEKKLSGDPSLHTIVFDDSFSIKGREALLQNTANKILEQIPNKDQIIWININSGLIFKGMKEDLPSISKFVKTTYLSGSLTNTIQIINENINTSFTSYELYILSDSQQEMISSIQENAYHLKLFNIHL